MRVIRSEHREAEGGITVSLLFKTREQLLDPDDPSAPPQQELTEEAEAAIISNFDAVPLKTPAVLEIRFRRYLIPTVHPSRMQSATISGMCSTNTNGTGGSF